MAFPRIPASRMRIWRSQPGVGRVGTEPVGAIPLGRAVVWAGALFVHASLRAIDRSPAEIHAVTVGNDIVGSARIIDGDTIDIHGTRIRLQGIDAPESDQSCVDAGHRAWRCGKVATRALVGYVGGRPLHCRSSGFDRYRRVLAACALPDGSDINAWMVRQGWALAYYSDTYRPQEAQAHAAKRGIWAGTFMPPWEWRHRHSH